MWYETYVGIARVYSMTALEYEKQREISSAPQECTKSILQFHALQNALQN
jgi:hypothetical protein